MQLEQNVAEFLEKTAKEVGRFKALGYKSMVQVELQDFNLNSPIEKIFYIALTAYADYYGLHYQLLKADQDNLVHGVIHINPQYQIGNYKVDFLLQTFNISGKLNSVVIELDGHDFHDKNKEQRAYEKSRDRFITREGYKVLHFTGSELVKDPFGAVLEAFNALEIIDASGLEYHSPEMPFLLD